MKEIIDHFNILVLAVFRSETVHCMVQQREQATSYPLYPVIQNNESTIMNRSMVNAI